MDNETILGESGPENDDGFLMTKKTYKNFHAFLRFKCETNTNSGLFYHTTIPEDISKITFIQVEIDNRPGRHTAGLHGSGRSWIVWPAQEKEFYLRAVRVERLARQGRREANPHLPERDRDGRLHVPQAACHRRRAGATNSLRAATHEYGSRMSGVRDLGGR